MHRPLSLTRSLLPKQRLVFLSTCQGETHKKTLIQILWIWIGVYPLTSHLIFIQPISTILSTPRSTNLFVNWAFSALRHQLWHFLTETSKPGMSPLPCSCLTPATPIVPNTHLNVFVLCQVYVPIFLCYNRDDVKHGIVIVLSSTDFHTVLGREATTLGRWRASIQIQI